MIAGHLKEAPETRERQVADHRAPRTRHTILVRTPASPFCAELAVVPSPRHWESRLTVLRFFYEDCLRTP